MRDKIQTSLWLDKDVKLLIENEDLNLTKWVNDNILLSLSVDTPEKVEVKIRLKESELMLLKKRLEKMQEAKETIVEAGEKKNKILGVLKDHYAARAKNNLDHNANSRWIRSPRNLQRCKALKKTPEEILNILDG